MYAIAIMNPVRALMTFATSTDTLIVTCAFMGLFQSGTASQRCQAAVKTVAVLWCLLTCKACTHTRTWDASLVIEHLTEHLPMLREVHWVAWLLFRVSIAPDQELPILYI